MDLLVEPIVEADKLPASARGGVSRKPAPGRAGRSERGVAGRPARRRSAPAGIAHPANPASGDQRRTGKPDRKHEVDDRGIPVSQRRAAIVQRGVGNGEGGNAIGQRRTPDHQQRTAWQERPVDAGQQRPSESSRQHANRDHLSRRRTPHQEFHAGGEGGVFAARRRPRPSGDRYRFPAFLRSSFARTSGRFSAPWRLSSTSSTSRTRARPTSCGYGRTARSPTSSPAS